MMGRKRKEIAMACDAEGELDMKSNVHFLHIPYYFYETVKRKWSVRELQRQIKEAA
jgi:hypothetical protein